MRAIIHGLSALLVFAGGMGAAWAHETRAAPAEFDAYISSVLDDADIPGLALAVVRDGRIVRLAGYGYADIATGRRMTPDTPINLASISKPVLGIALMRLARDGKLDLDADVNDYLDFTIDNPNVTDETISVRKLASHTSGIIDADFEGEYVAGVDAPTPLPVFISQMLSPGGAHYADGAHYTKNATLVREYSNLGGTLAGAVAEAIAGESLDAYQQRTLFEPLGMTRTSWRIAHYPPNELATRYRVRPSEPDAPRRLKHFEAYPQLGIPDYPDGGLNASARDLASLMCAILAKDPRVATPAGYADMFRLQATDGRQRFFWRDRDGLTGHMGSDLGIFTALYFDRATRNGFVVLMNRTPDASTEAAMARVVARIVATPFGPDAAPVPATPGRRP